MDDAIIFMAGIFIGTIITSVALVVAMMTDEIRNNSK